WTPPGIRSPDPITCFFAKRDKPESAARMVLWRYAQKTKVMEGAEGPSPSATLWFFEAHTAAPLFSRRFNFI
ncbi:MAG: hypothetical protein AB7D00_12665, partial [Rhodospirillaceae bacterium]